MYAKLMDETHDPKMHELLSNCTNISVKGRYYSKSNYEPVILASYNPSHKSVIAQTKIGSLTDKVFCMVWAERKGNGTIKLPELPHLIDVEFTAIVTKETVHFSVSSPDPRAAWFWAHIDVW